MLSVDHIVFCCSGDRPLIVQFAAHSAEQFASAAEIVAP